MPRRGAEAPAKARPAATPMPRARHAPAPASLALRVELPRGGGRVAAAPAIVAFGDVPLNSPAPDAPVTVTNAGNEPISLSFADPGDAQFRIAWTGQPAAVSLAPGAK